MIIQKFLKVLLFILVCISTNARASSQFEIDATYAILQDHLSGEILYEKDADAKIYPASMTKIMTSIIAFDLLKDEKIKLSDEVIISENAWRMSKSGYSSMFIMLNDKVTIEELLKGIIIVSGNDACVALAEGIAGTESAFADMMNDKAAELGLENTNFSHSSLLLIIYVLIIYRIIAVGTLVRNNFARLYCYGFAAAFFVYVTVNMSMVLGLLPIVGAPLPIMSYGGSSMLSIMTGLGIVMSFKVHQQEEPN